MLRSCCRSFARIVGLGPRGQNILRPINSRRVEVGGQEVYNWIETRPRPSRKINYKLKLFKNIKINPIFYILLLKLTTNDALFITPDLFKDQEIISYKIEVIINYKEELS